ncbi:uncharacterized protein CDAR_45491 [Caerostris darwini]|uniref:Uncharacterized protein n=1 Tax=Caerostris darwini TaxID=1538125 RepID=A0AAV4M2N8_9ARAC|nr:uncharacterized protein CDAR_45491 [Caerostris darwini]
MEHSKTDRNIILWIKNSPPPVSKSAATDKIVKSKVSPFETDEVELPDAYYGTFEDRQKYHTLDKTLPPPVSKSAAADKIVKSKVSPFETHEVELPDAYYGTFEDRQKYHTLDKTLPPPLSKSVAADKKQKSEVSPFETHEVELPDAYYGTFEDRQKYHTLDKTLPPPGSKSAAADKILKSKVPPFETHEILLPNGYYGTFADRYTYHALKKFLPPPEIVAVDNYHSCMKTHEFLLPEGHYGTSGTRQAYHTMEKFIPPCQSEIALTNRDHPCSDAHKLLLPVSHFGTFEERQKYHLLKKILPSSKSESIAAVGKNLKNQATLSSLNPQGISLSDAYYGTGREDYSVISKTSKIGLISNNTFEQNTFYKMDNVSVRQKEKRKYYNLTKTLPPLKPKSEESNINLKDISWERSFEFPIETKYVSLEATEFAHSGPMKVTECQYQKPFQMEGAEFSQDLANFLHCLKPLLLDDQHKRETSASTALSVFRGNPNLDISGELLTLLKTLQNRITEKILESGGLNSLIPLPSTSFQKPAWDVLYNFGNYALPTDSTSTEPLILTITKSSDPNTAIELNFNEFLQYYCPQYAKEELKDSQIINISEVTDIPSDKDEIIEKRHTLEMDMPVIEPVTFLKDLGKDVILAVISKNIQDPSNEQTQNEENFRKDEQSKDSSSEEKLKIIDRDDGMTSESEKLLNLKQLKQEDVTLTILSKNIPDPSSEQIQNEENFRKDEQSKDSSSEEKIKTIDSISSKSEKKLSIFKQLKQEDGKHEDCRQDKVTKTKPFEKGKDQTLIKGQQTRYIERNGKLDEEDKKYLFEMVPQYKTCGISEPQMASIPIFLNDQLHVLENKDKIMETLSVSSTGKTEHLEDDYEFKESQSNVPQRRMVRFRDPTEDETGPASRKKKSELFWMKIIKFLEPLSLKGKQPILKMLQSDQIQFNINLGEEVF